MRRAREEMLGEGVGPWSAELVWHRAYEWPGIEEDIGVPPVVAGAFAWRVQNVTDPRGLGGDGYVLDANDGRLLLRDPWFRVGL